MTHDKPKASASKTASANSQKCVLDTSPDQTHKTSKSKKRPNEDVEDDLSSTMVMQKRWTLAPGSLVVMQGETQKFWKHEIPK